MSKLTDRQRKRIIAEYISGGISQRKLAERYHVSQKTISTILRDEEVRQKVSLKKEENTKDMLAFLDSRKTAAMTLIDTALDLAKGKMKKASLKDTMGAVKILSEVFGNVKSESHSSGDDTITEIIIQPEDASLLETGDTEGDNATDG